MRVYEISYRKDEEEHRFWVGSQETSSSKRAKLRKAGYKILSTTARDIPTDKRGLIRWLNENITF